LDCSTDWVDLTAADIAAVLDPVRQTILETTGGHYPAPVAILDCLYRGMKVDMDQAVVAEMDVFKDLVQRIEARNMIQVQFLGRVDYDKAKRKGTLPACLDDFLNNVSATLHGAIKDRGPLGVKAAAFAGISVGGKTPVADAATADHLAARLPQWFEAPETELETAALAILANTALAAGTFSHDLSEAERNLADYAACRATGFPVYLGGPFSVLRQFGVGRLMELGDQ